MYRTIILALDDSEGAARAIPHAATLAKSEGAWIIVAHATTHAVESQVDNVLARHLDDIRGLGVNARLEKAQALVGEEAMALAKIAADEHADLVVIANRGRGPFEGAFLGSVTQRLISLAPCPVLVVPGHIS